MPRKPESHQTLLRQWDMLRLIPRHPVKVATSRLVERLADQGYAVTKRTVERDLLTLSEVFPLFSDTRSMPYGWSWQPHAAPFDVPQLTATQALAFVLMQEYLATLLPGSVSTDLEPYFRMARQRLADVASGGAGRHWLERVRIIPPTQALIPPKIVPAVHSAVTEALLRECKLAITYRNRSSDKSREAVVHPLGLVQRGPLLYLAVTFEGYEDAKPRPAPYLEGGGAARACRTAGGVRSRPAHGQGHPRLRLRQVDQARRPLRAGGHDPPRGVAPERGPVPGARGRGHGEGHGHCHRDAAALGGCWVRGRVEVLKPSGLRGQMMETARAMAGRYGMKAG